jgi:drug/metabolite transporter (DMT)-like permease
MLLLLTVSLVWAVSFGLVKGLAGLDPTAVAVVRLAISLAVFAPLLRTRGLGAARGLRLSAIGAVQFGAMYVLYLRSYSSLHAYQVALFTITTPLFVTAIDSALERRWNARFLLAAALSVAGACVLLWRSGAEEGILGGIVLVQLSNACFAAGQVAWRRERLPAARGAGEAALFALPLAGGLVLTLAASAFMTDWRAFAPTGAQWLSIAYLGVVASGAGFFLWNLGALRVNAGVLAAFNNAKIPLGVASSLLLFGEHADLGRLVAGGSLMAAGVWSARGRPAPAVT